MFDKILIANRGAERLVAASFIGPLRAAQGDLAARKPCSTRS